MDRLYEERITWKDWNHYFTVKKLLWDVHIYFVYAWTVIIMTPYQVLVISGIAFSFHFYIQLHLSLPSQFQ